MYINTYVYEASMYVKNRGQPCVSFLMYHHPPEFVCERDKVSQWPGAHQASRLCICQFRNSRSLHSTGVLSDATIHGLANLVIPPASTVFFFNIFKIYLNYEYECFAFVYAYAYLVPTAARRVRYIPRTGATEGHEVAEIKQYS